MPLAIRYNAGSRQIVSPPKYLMSVLGPATRRRLHHCIVCFALLFVIAVTSQADDGNVTRPESIRRFIDQHCLDCHEGVDAEAGLNLSTLSFNLSDRDIFARWVLIHDRVRDGEMPPPTDFPQPVLPIGKSLDWGNAGDALDSDSFDIAAKSLLSELAELLAAKDQRRIDKEGRSKVRRLNRYEYENTLREFLDAPWLQVAHLLPEDGVGHLFNKVGERLDVSHVQISKYWETSQYALRLAINAAAHPSQTRKFYAREEPTMQGYLHYRFGQRAATRAIVPLVGLTPEPDVIRKRQPVTVGNADPLKREQEAMGVFSGVYSATTKYDFSRIDAPTDGHYRLRLKSYTFTAGPNGANGGDDHGLSGGRQAWWRPNRNVAFIGQRTEPITLYALSSGGDSRWLTTFDAKPEPTVFECVVALRTGEGIRPDAARLVRTRPGWAGNPNASREGVPGFAMNWLIVEGPLHDEWPPASYRSIFGDLPFEVFNGHVKAIPTDASSDARRLLHSLNARLSSFGTDASVATYTAVFAKATELGADFTDAMIAAASAMLCSPGLLYFDAPAGPLSEADFHQRLAYFLWNGPAGDHELSSDLDVSSTSAIRMAVERLLRDERRERFVAAFLDYWLDLRDINSNTPDAELYPDYYLDEMLTESSVLETRRFFRELIDRDLPVQNLIDSDFVFVNERLAEHYALPPCEGVQLRRVDLPVASPRGGLLTQASVLRVTANGTTTSPVIRGAWIMERILGMNIPDPPSGVAAVEPDIRGAQTIREQLEKHRAIESCNACHAKFDPVGFALESFDVAGGWRTRYRSVGECGEPVQGFGKNGHAFRFKDAQPVNCAGQLANDAQFKNIMELKRLLLSQQRQLARNLVHRFVVYATGAPISFADRAEVERILDHAQASEYGVRTLIHHVVQSQLFQHK